MNKAQYAAYEAAVKQFSEQEGIDNLSGGHLSCPGCGPDTYDSEFKWDDNGNCPKCGQSSELYNEPFFSWRPCDCCKSRLGGNREHATGYNSNTHEIQEYNVCVDCIYYAAYGRLDDMTMLEVEDDKDA